MASRKEHETESTRISLNRSLTQKTGEFYPQRDENGTARLRDSGATYYITDQSTELGEPIHPNSFTQRERFMPYNSLGDPIDHFNINAGIMDKGQLFL